MQCLLLLALILPLGQVGTEETSTNSRWITTALSSEASSNVSDNHITNDPESALATGTQSYTSSIRRSETTEAVAEFTSIPQRNTSTSNMNRSQTTAWPEFTSIPQRNTSNMNMSQTTAWSGVSNSTKEHDNIFVYERLEESTMSFTGSSYPQRRISKFAPSWHLPVGRLLGTALLLLWNPVTSPT
ncbi:hypothetical protein FKM82_013119 [Ascaphus truei]